MRTRNAVLVGTMCAGLAAALAGCAEDPDAGTNGVGKLEASAIATKARTAAEGASAVHLTGNLVSRGHTYKLDMRLKKNGGSGKVASEASTFQLLRIGADLYLKADAAFWSHQKDQQGKQSGGSAADKLDAKYVKVPSGDPSYKELSGFTDKAVLLDGVLGLHGKLSRGDHGSVGGVRTIRISGGGGDGGSLDVALKGTPYPLRLQRAGGAGVVQLAEWDKDFALAAPAKDQMVDYGRKIPRGN
ncbi:hypothetical protein AB0I22_03340 [Streptomyces sp. NPDC050610]|uniref:hypothetical protein n=1 Tax=Streptomyces sp. NPDC050610 TaxID=3157097 RepID=UPI00342211B7